MSKLKTLAILPAIAAALIGIGVAAALSADRHAVELDRSMEQACHREVKKRSPLGHRDLRTFAYSLEEPKVGLATGGLRSEFRPGRWSPVNWACRMHTESGRILRVEFSWPHGGNRLHAISSSI